MGDDGRPPAQTEFVVNEFETEVPEAAVEDLAAVVETVVRRLRSRIRSDERLEELLRSDPGETVLTSSDVTESADPEPLTQRAVVEPLLSALGYAEFAVEAGDLSGEYGMQADYSVSLRDVDSVDSERLLFEVEPLGKRLHQQRHGVGQVKDWLERRQFAADFGVATDGLRWILLKYDPDTYGFDTLAEVDLRPVFVGMFETVAVGETTAAEWLDGEAAGLLEAFVRSFGYENVLSIAGEARSVIKRRKREITEAFYDDYVRLVFGIVDGDERTERSLVGGGVQPPPGATGDDVRLFAVELMNRLVFIKFLEDKGLVAETLLSDLAADHQSGISPDSFYKSYLEPLFFGVLDERPETRTERVRDIGVYADVPYLDGGLFRPTVENGGEFDEEDFDVSDSVLLAIVDLLEEYRFSADGGPGDLDPSVLGNVFEKTINHITTDEGDQQKELGAYYTPDEITRFCAEETVQPGLLERFADRMVEEWGWTREMADAHDDVYELVDALPGTNTAVVDDLLDVVDRFRALDPACGSGHFLTSVESEIVAVRKALYANHDADPSDWELRKQTVVENIYGVDIVSPAVEIAKLRLWLSIIAAVDPDQVSEYDDGELALPNVVFNVRQGNSLIGFTELVETGDGENQTRLSSWGPDSVQEMYGDIIDLVEKHKTTSDTEEARRYLYEADELLTEFRTQADEHLLDEFYAADIDDIPLERLREFRPFHWVLEFASVYADGGFDVVIGNPPWDRIKPNRDDFFSRHAPGFRALRGDAKDELQQELLEDAAIAQEWEEYQRDIEIRAQYFNEGPAYRMQKATIANRTQASENDLSSLFFERVLTLARDDGYISQVLPGRIFHGAPTKSLRQHVLDNTSVRSLVSFENHGIFDAIDTRYNFGVLTFRNQGQTETLRGIFQQRDLSVLQNPEKLVDIPKEVLVSFAPSSLLFPRIQNNKDVDVLWTAIQHPPVGDTDRQWYAEPTRPLDKTSDSECFFDNPDGCDYPILTGRNFFNYCYDPTFINDLEPPFQWSVSEETNPSRSAKRRIREKKMNRLKRGLYDAFDGTGSMRSFVDSLLKERRGEPLTPEDVRLPSTVYRLGFRRVARGTDERSLIAAVVPPGPVCDYSFYIIEPFDIDLQEADLTKSPLHDIYERRFSDQELFVALGLLNSLPFDFLIRRKIDNSIPIYSFNETQIPDLTDGDDWFRYISSRAARLNCYGEAFAEMRDRLGGLDPATGTDERTQLQAEIDAAAFHAYGLDREETAFVLEDFHRVENPRLMTDDYFDRVLDVYDDLADQEPKP